MDCCQMVSGTPCCGFCMEKCHMPFRKPGAGQEVLWPVQGCEKGLCIFQGCLWTVTARAEGHT